jgi:hypothetical protein
MNRPIITTCFLQRIANGKFRQFHSIKDTNVYSMLIQTVETTPFYKGVLYDIEICKRGKSRLFDRVWLSRHWGSVTTHIYLEPYVDIEVLLFSQESWRREPKGLWVIPTRYGCRIYLCNVWKMIKMWTLMCPDECPGLADVHGEKFNQLWPNMKLRNGVAKPSCS